MSIPLSTTLSLSYLSDDSAKKALYIGSTVMKEIAFIFAEVISVCSRQKDCKNNILEFGHIVAQKALLECFVALCHKHRC